MNEVSKSHQCTLEWLEEQPLDVKLSILRHHKEMVRILVNTILEEEVTALSGERYAREKPHDGRYSRWGTNPGSVRIGVEKYPLEVPRIYDNAEECNRPLANYSKLKELAEPTEELVNAVLLGVGTRNYGKVVETLADGFGMSKSQLSKEFIERSSDELREFNERSFSQHDFVALFIDGKSQKKQQIVIALGVDSKGEKIPLGFVQSTTENAVIVKELLGNLIERGLHYEKGLYVVIDGAKGLNKAVEETFGPYAVIARCQWHKRENVVSYLPDEEKEPWRRRLTAAHGIADYGKAKERLLAIKKELEIVNKSAANSLEEGLEETLMLQRLGLHEGFHRSFSTTNCIENLNSMISRFTRSVKYWVNSDQRHRWISMALLEAEQRMFRVYNAVHLPMFQQTINREVQRRLLAMQESESNTFLRRTPKQKACI